MFMIDLIKYPVLTEKATRLLEKNQYTFKVDSRLNKTAIKSTVEVLFGVKVLAVNTYNPPRKSRRLGRFKGFKSNYKRVIITLRPDESIPLFSES